ncbi:hypothetical protein NKG99_27910 [Mesorhizobium sp. M1409]|uniref:hypothetical protein n=1 Tax=unclassified Mesorhizobium TaxID=325217 RepID=UPI0033383A24
MFTAEAGASAVRATRFDNESDSLEPIALCRSAAKLLEARLTGKQDINPPVANDLLEKGNR